MTGFVVQGHKYHYKTYKQYYLCYHEIITIKLLLSTNAMTKIKYINENTFLYERISISALTFLL